MCTTCGCGPDHVHIDGEPQHDHGIAYRPRTPSAKTAAHTHTTDNETDSDLATLHQHSHAPGISPARMVQIERDILSKNDAYADANRATLAGRGIFALNLVSSPGSGKTTLLCKTIELLRGRHEVAVIEGDQQTDQDAARIRATGAPAIQINTGKGCHLDAQMVGRAMEKLPLAANGLLMIENVGNLVCPAAFDLGEAHKVVILSVTEGEDKPIKYPDMFRAATLMLLNKCDLLPYLSFDVNRAIAYARQVNPGLEVIQTSATRGDGMDSWLEWIENRRLGLRVAAPATAAAAAAEGAARYRRIG